MEDMFFFVKETCFFGLALMEDMVFLNDFFCKKNISRKVARAT